jgi:hypothetical protein
LAPIHIISAWRGQAEAWLSPLNERQPKENKMELPPKLRLLELFCVQLEHPAEEIIEFNKLKKAVPQPFLNKLDRLQKASKLRTRLNQAPFLLEIRESVWRGINERGGIEEWEEEEIESLVENVVALHLTELEILEKANNVKIGANSIEIRTPVTSKPKKPK